MSVKRAMLESLRDAAVKHRADDRLIQEMYAADEVDDRDGARDVSGNLRGCSIGCLVMELAGEDFPTGEAMFELLVRETGVPKWWWKFQDDVFEILPVGAYGSWHVDACAALAGVQDWDGLNARIREAILQYGREAYLERWPNDDLLPQGRSLEEAISCVRGGTDPFRTAVRFLNAAVSDSLAEVAVDKVPALTSALFLVCGSPLEKAFLGPLVLVALDEETKFAERMIAALKGA